MPSSFFDKLKDSIGVEELEAEEEKKEKPSKKKAAKAEKEKADKEIKKIFITDESDAKEKKKDKNWMYEEAEGELAIDMYQTKGNIIIETAVAGVKPDDLDISIENDIVTIRGNRESCEVEEEKNYFHQECYWGTFSRELILPEEIDASKAAASFKDGILTLKLPKLKREKVKKVKVKG